jgi:DNA-binding CsgD family transcriptional regulator
MTTVAEHLVGRAAELGALERAMDEVKRGGPAALLIEGDPGIGKSRLLAELGARADARGWIVLSGSASELEADLPFWIFVEALEEYVAGMDPRRLASLDDDVQAELALLLPALAGTAARRGPAPQDERYRTHRAMRKLLERVAAGVPLALALDDVHWADAASVELLAALLRRPPAAAVLLALTARPRQVPERLASALERAHRGGGLTRLPLGALGRAEAGELLGAGIEVELADALYSDSGGNPFYLEQLARALRRTGVAAGAPAGTRLAGVEVPSAVAASVTDELARLPAGTRRVLEGASVAGDPFEPELAGAGAGVDEAATAGAIDALLAHGLVRETDVPRRFRFRHPLIRRAVYEAAPGGWRLGAHERCSQALAERGAAPAAQAHHLEHAGRHGDPAAIALLAEAGEAAAARAPASAASWFGAALRLLPDTAPAEQRIGLLTARARALAATGQLTSARDALLECIELLPAAAVGPRTSLTAACAGIEHLLGDHDRARARLAAALEGLPAAAAPEAVTLMLELAVESLFDTDYAAMRGWAERAVAGARPLDDRPLAAAAAGLAALAAACAGDVAEAEARRAEALALVDALADAELAQRLAGAGFLGAAELYLDHYAEAAAHAARGLAVARATGQRSPTLVPTLITAWFMLGRLGEAEQELEIAVETARSHGIPQGLAWTLVNRSFAAMAGGELDTALASAEESLAVTRGIDERFTSAWSGLALATALLPSGDPARAVEELLRWSGGEEVAAIPAGWRALGLLLLVRARLALGLRDEARASLARAEAVAAALGLPLSAAWAHRAAAEVALDAGEPATAAQRALAAAAAAEEAEAVIEAALARTLAGRALAEGGERDAAVVELEQAAATLDTCGAPRLRDAAERELRKLGRPAHRRSRRGSADGAGLDTLTERERQVAALVVDRRTNPEIAAELFLSLKTVETHLRNIFRKLDVASRVELARLVERADREP